MGMKKILLNHLLTLVIALTASAQTPAPAQPGPKKPGVIRVGVTLPAAQFGPGSSPAAGEPIRQSIIGYLTGPNVEAVPIVALLPVQAEAEAAQKECDYIVASSITQKRADSGRGTGFLKGAASMSSQIPCSERRTGLAGRLPGRPPEPR